MGHLFLGTEASILGLEIHVQVVKLLPTSHVALALLLAPLKMLPHPVIGAERELILPVLRLGLVILER